MWQPGWEGSLGENGYMKWMDTYMYGWVSSLFTWNYCKVACYLVVPQYKIKSWKNTLSNAGDLYVIPGQRTKISHVAGQLSQNTKTRDSPRATVKTQSSQGKKKKTWEFGHRRAVKHNPCEDGGRDAADVSTSQGMQDCQQTPRIQERGLRGTKPAGTLTSDLQPPELWANTFMLFKHPLPSLWYLATEALRNAPRNWIFKIHFNFK